VKWASLIRNLFASLVGVVVGSAIFGGLQYYFKPELWISVVVAVLGALYSAIGPTLDFVKKGYEIRKLHLDVRKLAREEEAAGSLIRLPTDEELRLYNRPEQVKNLPFEKEHLLTEDIVTDVNVREVSEVTEVSGFRRVLEKLFNSGQ
jgi:hypothetical protein